MEYKRFDLALERLEASEWEVFENFASEFLASEFADHRTTASPSGDGGRDAELFTYGKPSVVFQYSVTSSWKTKIIQTANRIKEKLPDARILVYVTNQKIGALADGIKKELLENFELHLDIRDRTYFLDRYRGDAHREHIAEELAKKIADPYLASKDVFPLKPTELSSSEARAAFVYLGLQWHDDTREKGLTKLSFEALVRSVLKDTSLEDRMPRDEIKAKVKELLPNHDPNIVDTYTDSALKRLTNRAIKHWMKDDEFCLSHDERLRLRDYLAELELKEEDLSNEISLILKQVCEENKLDYSLVSNSQERARRILERFLFNRSETFASALLSGSLKKSILPDELNDCIIQDISAHPADKVVAAKLPNLLSTVITEILTSPKESIRIYLRNLSDSYSLLLFLKFTPDIQSAVKKIFSHGDIWLDATIILPLLGEQLKPPHERRFESILNAAKEAGLNLKVTHGILEEVGAHMNRALTYFRTPSSYWRGGIPLLSLCYIESGKPSGGFSSWLDFFRGEEHPEDDLAEYLYIHWGVTLESLEKDANSAPPELQHALQEIWHEAHEIRRARAGIEVDPAIINILVKHDVECYAGVIQRRKQEKISIFGFSAWWLTMDHKAFNVEGQLLSHLTSPPPSSPVLSMDFLVNYLAFGPARRSLSKTTESRLPLFFDIGLTQYLTPAIIEETEKLRREMAGMPDYLVNRKVRENLNSARRRLGNVARSGFESMDDDLLSH